MRGAFAAAWCVLALAIAPAAVAREPGMFCLDRAELAAQRENASALAKQYIYSETSTFGPMLADYERTLTRAEGGDAAARRKVGGLWAACILGEDEMSAAKQATAATYLGEAAQREDRQAQMYLGQLHALGAGVPADYAQAYRLIVASGQAADSAERYAGLNSLLNATQSEQQAAWIYAEMLRALLQTRLQGSLGKIAGVKATGLTLQAQVAFGTCPNRAEILEASEDLKREPLEALLQSLVQRLPSAGLPCRTNGGVPFKFVLPFTIKMP
ncbi:MAG: hypothetical protein HOQ32_01365 [Lysobacter sp.]|nr:hypothetical protein [Lysobacter sp.]